jgi:hypothetical protein
MDRISGRIGAIERSILAISALVPKTTGTQALSSRHWARIVLASLILQLSAPTDTSPSLSIDACPMSSVVFKSMK